MLGVKTLLVALVAYAGAAEAVMRCVPWAVDNRWATKIKSGKIGCYHHWADGRVGQFGDTEYVPNYWGLKNKGKWNKVKGSFKSHWPKHILAFNEPDIKSQAGMSPSTAANEYMKELWPYHKKGVKLGSPAPAWDLDWLSKFLSAIKKKGGKVDFICIHWYGGHTKLGTFKKYVQTAHKKFPGYKIWITEFGTTTSSHPSRQDAKNFATNAFKWLNSQSYVERAFWFGGFANAPDGYASQNNGFFTNGGGLTSLGKWFKSGSFSRRELKRHQLLERGDFEERDELDDDADDEDDELVYDGEPVDCDEICQLREAQLAKFDEEDALRKRLESLDSRESAAAEELMKRLEALEEREADYEDFEEA